MWCLLLLLSVGACFSCSLRCALRVFRCSLFVICGSMCVVCCVLRGCFFVVCLVDVADVCRELGVASCVLVRRCRVLLAVC